MIDLTELGPLYHDFSLFGANNLVLPGIYAPNQKCKAPIILGYIQWALAKCRNRADDAVTFAELFCADGFYALAARKFGASHSLGIDNGRDLHFKQAEKSLGFWEYQM